MGRCVRLIVGLALLGALVSPARATDRDTFDNSIAKVAPSLGIGLPFTPRSSHRPPGSPFRS